MFRKKDLMIKFPEVADKAETKIRSQIMDGVKGSLECQTENMEFF